MAAIKAKKASEEQKEFFVNFMEINVEFANDRFESIDGAHTRARKWCEFADNLNSLGGAMKDGPKWRKFWLDQKIHVKERDALLKAAFERSGVNGPKKIKPLTDFEKRVLQLMVPAVVHGNEEVEELFTTADSIATGQMVEEWLLEETPAGESSEKPPPAAVQPTNITAPRKRQRQPSGKKLSMEERLVEIEEEKLLYIRKNYELDQRKFEAEEEWRKSWLEFKKKKN